MRPPGYSPSEIEDIAELVLFGIARLTVWCRDGSRKTLRADKKRRAPSEASNA